MNSPGQRPPNILLLLPDQWRRDWTGLPDGVGIDTPNIVRLADRGSRFTNAFCPSPLCAPARACLASGLEYHRTGVRSNAQNYPIELPTFYARLRDAGYSVLGCGKFDLHKPEYTWGPDGSHLLGEWGFTGGIDSEGKIDGIAAWNRSTPGPYLSYLSRRGVVQAYVDDMELRRGANSLATHLSPLDDQDYGDNWVTRNALELLSEADQSRPWFLQVNFPGPHGPFDVTPKMNEWCRDTRMPDAVACDHDSTAVQRTRRAYSAMCRNIDERIGDLTKWLESTHQLDNTVVIFSSDHGEMLGDHDRWGKNRALTPSLGVPLVMAGPGIPTGQTVTRAVSNLDITATILSAADLPVPAGIDSVSLLEARGRLRTFDPTARPITAALEEGKNSWRCALDDDYKLVVHAEGTTELFAYRDDVHEMENLVAARPEVVARLERALPPSVESPSGHRPTE
ncbi:MAG: hypothetical protein EA382_17715 [Spirochaetaceae bacterium]|nr:MAG: hypothetical protein EA382_17715 [Spirochaetaceae bacterium]